MNKNIGTDSAGTWTPHQYAIDAGWDYTCIEATAAKGVSEADVEGLSDEQQAALLDFCKTRVVEKAHKNAVAWVRDHSDDDILDDADLEKAFRAIFEREPDDKDREQGLWSHLCAAVQAEVL